MKISQKGIDLIKKFESLHDGDLKVIGLQPKLCPAGIFTVGYGRALTNPKTGKYLMKEDKELAYSLYPNLTEEQAEIMLAEDLKEREKRLNSLKLNLNQGQYDAIISFIYNVGFANFLSSTLLKKIRANSCDPSIAYEFSRWNKAGGKVLPGLVKRRKAESDLYFS